MSTAESVPDHYTVSELTRMFQMAHATVTKRLSGVPHKMRGKRKVYHVSQAAPALLQVGRQTLDPAQEIARVNAERARQLEMKNAVEERRLVPVDLVTAACASTASRMGAILDAVAAELKRKNPALTNSDITMVKRELARARNEAASVEIDWRALDA